MTVSKLLFYSMARGERMPESVSNKLEFRRIRRAFTVEVPLVSPFRFAGNFECAALAAGYGFLLQAFPRAQLQLDMSFELDRMANYPRLNSRNGLLCGGDIRKLFVFI